jgi:hypothetical protein
MNKKVTLGPRPTTHQVATPSPDDWIENRATGDEPEVIKRLTFDVPLGLHTAIKTDCAARGKKMNEEIVAMLETRWRPERAKE